MKLELKAIKYFRATRKKYFFIEYTELKVLTTVLKFSSLHSLF